MDEQLLSALASPSFLCLRNYGDRWGISHVSFDGVSIAEIFDSTLDRLLETWVELSEAIELHRQGNSSDEHIHDWYKSVDGGTELCRCGAWR
jgi:hypothetical protein